MTDFEREFAEIFVPAERVLPDRLDIAMALLGCKTYVEFADLCDVGESTVRNWAQGRTDTSLNSFAKLEKGSGLPRQFYTGEEPLRMLVDVNFRSKPRKLERERTSLVAWGSLAEFLQRQVRGSATPLRMASALTPGMQGRNSPEVEAVHFRRRAGLQDNQPAGDLIELAEANGVLVVYGPTTTEEIDAFSGWGNGRPIMVLNPFKGSYLRQRFDAAHEIGHVQMHRHSDDAVRSKENDANMFAGALLYPPTNDNSRRLSNAMKHDDGLDSLINIQEEWRVSVSALIEIAARRISRCGPVAALKRELLREAGAIGVGPSATRPAEQPSILADAVESLELEMERPIGTLALEFGVSMQDVEIMIARDSRTARAAAEARSSFGRLGTEAAD